MMLSLHDLPEPLDAATVKRFHDSRIRSEQLLFLAICSERDRALLTEETQEMSLPDFDRITYLLETLGMTFYSTALQMQHPDLLKQLADTIEKEVADPNFDSDKEMNKIDQWRQDFYNQLPTETMKTYIGELIYL